MSKATNRHQYLQHWDEWACQGSTLAYQAGASLEEYQVFMTALTDMVNKSTEYSFPLLDVCWLLVDEMSGRVIHLDETHRALDDQPFTVRWFHPPHKTNSQGKVSVHMHNMGEDHEALYYASVIDAKYLCFNGKKDADEYEAYQEVKDGNI
jgi:hypothetical protein